MNTITIFGNGRDDTFFLSQYYSLWIDHKDIDMYVIGLVIVGGYFANME